MIKKPVKIKLDTGLEARPVAQLVQLASQFECEIHVEVEQKEVNAKSIMGMMALGIVPGQTVKISADGEDETQAIDSIEKYLGNK